MTLDNCTQEEGILLLALAGYTVKLADRTFGIFEGDKKIYGCSTLDWLQKPEFLMRKFIKETSFSRGIKQGIAKNQAEVRKVIGL